MSCTMWGSALTSMFVFVDSNEIYIYIYVEKESTERGEVLDIVIRPDTLYPWDESWQWVGSIALEREIQYIIHRIPATHRGGGICPRSAHTSFGLIMYGPNSLPLRICPPQYTWGILHQLHSTGSTITSQCFSSCCTYNRGLDHSL